MHRPVRLRYGVLPYRIGSPRRAVLREKVIRQFITRFKGSRESGTDFWKHHRPVAGELARLKTFPCPSANSGRPSGRNNAAGIFKPRPLRGLDDDAGCEPLYRSSRANE